MLTTNHTLITVTVKGKTDTSAFHLNNKTVYYPFKNNLHPFNALVKTFKRFSHSFKKDLHPFNGLVKTSKRFAYPFNENRIRLIALSDY